MTGIDWSEYTERLSKAMLRYPITSHVIGQEPSAFDKGSCIVIVPKAL